MSTYTITTINTVLNQSHVPSKKKNENIFFFHSSASSSAQSTESPPYRGMLPAAGRFICCAWYSSGLRGLVESQPSRKPTPLKTKTRPSRHHRRRRKVYKAENKSWPLAHGPNSCPVPGRSSPFSCQVHLAAVRVSQLPDFNLTRDRWLQT